MANIAYDFAVGFDIGRSMQAKAANKKMAEGLLEYRNELEGGSAGALPVDDDPDAKFARMQQAEDKFFAGLTSAGLPIDQAGAAMQAFNMVKSGYVLPQASQAIGTWGSPTGVEAFKRTFEAMSPGDVKDVKVQTGDDGEAIYMVDFGEKDEDGEPVYVPYDLEQMEMLYAGASGDPNTLIAFDKKQREASAAIAEGQMKVESHEADLAESEANVVNRNTASALNIERIAASEEDRAEGKPSAGLKVAQSRELADDLLDYPDLDDFRASNGGTFDAVFSEVFAALEGQSGVAPTRRQVLDAMQESMPTE